MKIKELLLSAKKPFALYFLIAVIVQLIVTLIMLDAETFMEYAYHPITQIAGALSSASILILVWAGYTVVKKLNVGIRDAGIVAVLIATISGIATSVIYYAFTAEKMNAILLAEPDNLIVASVLMAWNSPVLITMGIVMGFLIALGLGAIGGLIAKESS